DVAALADGLAYFFVFGLGFGWPLVLLPLLAVPLQRRLTRWSTSAHGWLTRGSGVLLIAIGFFGMVVEVLPNW
ncbi:MAG TPA: cytochrome c biogenesis protein CcdA, partial [Herpetosiphonaceae bacterium]